MQREDPLGGLGSPQAPSAFRGWKFIKRKDKSSLLQYWDTMLKDLFPNKLHIPAKTRKKNLLKGGEHEEWAKRKINPHLSLTSKNHAAAHSSHNYTHD